MRLNSLRKEATLVNLDSLELKMNQTAPNLAPNLSTAIDEKLALTSWFFEEPAWECMIRIYSLQYFKEDDRL